MSMLIKCLTRGTWGPYTEHHNLLRKIPSVSIPREVFSIRMVTNSQLKKASSGVNCDSQQLCPAGNQPNQDSPYH
jgi:hypothetical protein